MIEEYNRVAKSGCSIEKHALRTADRLEALIGLTSVVAVRLFQLKLVGRNQPDAKAATHVPSTWLKCLKLMRPKVRLTEMTVYSFFRELADAKAGVMEYWLIDARSPTLSMEILHLTEDGYRSASRTDAGYPSRVLTRNIALFQESDPLGNPRYQFRITTTS